MDIAQFDGFSPETLTFFEELAEHNDKAWFEDHRSDYEAAVLGPARAFVSDLGDRLKAWRPDVQADPRINGSLFKLHRDTRFSKDKTPFKTHLAAIFWEGDKRMTSPGFYFHLEHDHISLGGGVYMFTKEMREAWREAVDDEEFGAEIADVVEELAYPLQGEKLKRVPPGYDKEHSRGELLKHKGAYAMTRLEIDEGLFARDFLEVVLDVFGQVLPLHDALVRIQEHMSEEP